MRRPLAAKIALTLALALAAAPFAAAAQAPDAAALYDRLRRDGPGAGYWRALDKAFPDEGPHLLARELERKPDLSQALLGVLVEADRLPWSEPQLMMSAPDEQLLTQQRALGAVYVAALADDVGPCAADRARRELTSPELDRAWSRYRLAVMESAAAGRLEPVRRARAGATDRAFYEAAYRELRLDAGVPLNLDLRQLPRAQYCRAQIAAFAALERLPADIAARMAADMVDAAAALPDDRR